MRFHSYRNEMVGRIRTSTLASTPTLAEVAGLTERIVADTFAPQEADLSAGIFYRVVDRALEGVIAC